jgi:UDP-N-acetylmuramoyl-tripeptide--D-alanyl-D-alanine ligase
VTGSFGKSTTTQCILSACTDRLPKNFSGNYGISLAKNMLRIRPGDRHAVVETGISAPGQMDGIVKMVRPDMAVVTAIGSEHNRSFGSLETTRDEKANLVRALGEKGVAVLNGDDPNVLWMAGQTNATTVTFGFGPANQFRASDLRLDWPRGTRFTLHTVDGHCDVASPFLGRHMVYPVLAAVVVASHLGVDRRRFLSRLERWKPLPGRVQPLKLDSGAAVLRDDFKGPAETIHAAFDLLEKIPAKRKLVLMGEVSEPYGRQGPVYRKIGERIGKIATKAFFVCQKNGFKNYAAGARTAAMLKDNLTNYGSNGILELTAALRSELKDGDVLLVKGRDTQRLERIVFALQGRAVKCALAVCDAASTNCDNCPMLGPGWSGRKILF